MSRPPGNPGPLQYDAEYEIERERLGRLASQIRKEVFIQDLADEQSMRAERKRVRVRQEENAKRKVVEEPRRKQVSSFVTSVSF